MQPNLANKSCQVLYLKATSIFGYQHKKTTSIIEFSNYTVG